MVHFDMLLDQIASDAILDDAYAWLCHRRRDYPANADVWSFRRDWAFEKRRLQAELRDGTFRFGLLDRVMLADGNEIDLWSSRDALVLKAMTIVLSGVLPVSRHCTHVRGHGGVKAAVRRVIANLPSNGFVLRTDVKSYYASIDHHALLDCLAVHFQERPVLNLVGQYLRRTAERGGCFFDIERGISLGCPLSPLMAAVFLRELDQRLAASGVFHVRFMDDILVLTPTRWRLRRAVRLVNATLAHLGLEKHPDKTFIGRISRGFDFLGYHFSPAGLSVARATVLRAIERVARLYEQEPCGHSALLGAYLKRWTGWVRGGLGGLCVCPSLSYPAQAEEAAQCRQQEPCGCR